MQNENRSSMKIAVCPGSFDPITQGAFGYYPPNGKAL